MYSAVWDIFILAINTLEFYGYTGVLLKLKSRRFRDPYMYPKNYSLYVSWVHETWRSVKLFIRMFLNTILLMLIYTASIKILWNYESNDIKMK